MALGEHVAGVVAQRCGPSAQRGGAASWHHGLSNDELSCGGSVVVLGECSPRHGGAAAGWAPRVDVSSGGSPSLLYLHGCTMGCSLVAAPVTPQPDLVPPCPIRCLHSQIHPSW